MTISAFASLVKVAAVDRCFQVSKTREGSFLVRHFQDGSYAVIKAVDADLKAPATLTSACFWSLRKKGGDLITNGACDIVGRAFDAVDSARQRDLERRARRAGGLAMLMPQAC